MDSRDDRYHRLVSACKEAIEATQNIPADFSGVRAPIVASQVEQVLAILESDFPDESVMVEDFDGTVHAVANIVFQREEAVGFDILSEQALREHNDAVISIGTVRLLLTKYLVPFTKGEYWIRFEQKYRKVILAVK